MPISDDDAIRDVLAGNCAAFAGLVNAYYASCLRLAVHLLGSREDAEEVVQDTFVRAYRGLANYDHRGHFHAWLSSILINRCRTRAVRLSRTRTMFRPEGQLPASDETAASAGDPVLRRRLHEALQKLPHRQREAFLLKHVEGWSYSEMKRITRTEISALKMRVKRARAELRRLLGEQDDG
ncbi:MAG: RNA polymerase sigma factor [Candidatus Eisenbacteria sp.]|nr:RNA polymerase sigma factor [Candidatus Eisenbacteria bacterium]